MQQGNSINRPASARYEMEQRQKFKEELAGAAKTLLDRKRYKQRVNFYKTVMGHCKP